VITVAAEAAVGLAIVLTIYRNRDTGYGAINPFEVVSECSSQVIIAHKAEIPESPLSRNLCAATGKSQHVTIAEGRKITGFFGRAIQPIDLAWYCVEMALLYRCAELAADGIPILER